MDDPFLFGPSSSGLSEDPWFEKSREIPKPVAEENWLREPTKPVAEENWWLKLSSRAAAEAPTPSIFMPVKEAVKLTFRIEREPPVKKPCLKKEQSSSTMASEPSAKQPSRALSWLHHQSEWYAKVLREKEVRKDYSAWEFYVCCHLLPKRKFEESESLDPNQRALKEYLDDVRDTRGYGLTTTPPIWALQNVDVVPQAKSSILWPLDIHQQNPTDVKMMEDAVLAQTRGVYCKLLNLVGFGRKFDEHNFDRHLAIFSLHIAHDDEEKIAEACFKFYRLVELKIVNGETLVLSKPTSEPCSFLG